MEFTFLDQGSANFFVCVNGQTINILGFAGHGSLGTTFNTTVLALEPPQIKHKLLDMTVSD